ncbi:MAG: hypothetical protein K0S38_947 [Candidatus Paceibacter sp.]|jgi:16S rRNA (adenine1518-N6/adenine1519-N6)-dimethyltransferase|nr:hypothetical protein [Candidatus Paceibacter sp.]
MIPAKKSLGQNFLKSKEALRALVEAGAVTSDDVVLEVGPGKGVLTEQLVKSAKKVIAVEKDDRLIELLTEKFKTEIAEGKLEIVHQDVLEFDPEVLGVEHPSPSSTVLPSKGEFPSSELSGINAISRIPPLKEVPTRFAGAPARRGRRGGGCYKIIANIPYYITGAFLQKFLESDLQPSRMVIMLQKEVAQRIVAKDGKESILSMSVKAYGKPKYVMTVKAKYFSPEPNVDSAIIVIENISKDFFNDFSEEKFFEIMKLGFAHKRKMLVGNLSEKYSREHLLAAFSQVGINEKARAEDLELSQWKLLIQAL